MNPSSDELMTVVNFLVLIALMLVIAATHLGATPTWLIRKALGRNDITLAEWSDYRSLWFVMFDHIILIAVPVGYFVALAVNHSIYGY